MYLKLKYKPGRTNDTEKENDRYIRHDHMNSSGSLQDFDGTYDR